MKEFKKGKLHSGKGGKVVKKRSQALAIGMSYQRKGKKKRLEDYR
jgi:hypothetical protein